VPVVETSILRLLTLMGREISALLPDTIARTKAIFSDMPRPARRALLGQLRALIAQIDRCTQCHALPGFDTSETSPRATPAEQPG
jgi:hypothetical protein